MELKEFQLNAVKSLFEAMDKPVRDIILKSPTGSGKTIILTYFMHQYIQSYPKTVFVWLTPGKGNLEEQSKAKMDKYIHASQTKLLSDVMTAGFEENDSCFINWEKLTKKGNNALKDSERTNFLEHIEHALNDGLRFIIIVDESHQNNTIKADEIIQYFRTEKIIRCSATPKGIAKAEVIEISSSDMNTISVTEKLNTHKHGRDYHQKIGKIGLEIGMEYSFMNTIIRKLFDKNFNYAHKILALEPREVYAFVLNNADRLRHLVREAMAAEMAQMQLDVQTKSLFEFHIPQSCLFTYNGEAKTQIIYKKNVYQNYLSSAAPRSTPEVKFEKFCEHSGNVEWWYKNGDKGSEYFSIVYGDNSEKQKLFYPDYIVGISGEIWIIETKGGFDRSGNSQDIDIYTPKKFEALKAYLDAHGLKGGIVRNDATTDELCICMEHYSDDIGSDDWVLLENILG